MFRAFFVSMMAGFVVHIVFRTTFAAIFGNLSAAFLLGAAIYIFTKLHS